MPFSTRWNRNMSLGLKQLIHFGLPLAGMVAATDCLAVSPSPYKLFEEALTGLPVTNSMVMSWGISLLIIIGVRAMVGRPTLVPSTGQAFIENILGGIQGIMEPIVGKAMIRHVFPLLIGLFIFILMQNWSGLLPGVGAFGLYDEHGQLKYWMRPGNADLNMTIALALVAAVFSWTYFVLRYAGIKVLLYDLFGNKADVRDVPKVIYIMLFPIFFMVGMIEVVSILFRPVSLSFRLFGNVFGGENLLSNMSELASWLVPIPFYFLELLIGLVQALVFVLLTAVYIGLICNHEGGEEHAH
jgi:F-type H+-transporting ATPase subunit a